MNVIPASSRGHFTNDWLNSEHSFSFGEYYNPRRMGFSLLRVINEDRVTANGGFATHGHRDMEIITYVLDGELAHKDNLGNGSVIKPGDVQRMSAGSGILHSEFNHSSTKPVHFLQIWLLPTRTGIPPSYEQRYFSGESRQGQLRLIASPTGDADSLQINSDVQLYTAVLGHQDHIVYTKSAQRAVYIHVARGALTLNNSVLQAGDAAEMLTDQTLTLSTTQQAEILLFDLPLPSTRGA